MAWNTLQYSLIFNFKGNIIWTCPVGPFTSLSVAFISFAKKVVIDFCQFFSQLLRILFSLNLWNRKWGSPFSFKRKGAFISLLGIVWGKSLKVLANEDTLLRTHCCRHKCLPVCPRAQHLLRTQKCFWFCSETVCVQQMFPSLRAQGKVMSNNVSARMCPRLPPPLHFVRASAHVRALMTQKSCGRLSCRRWGLCEKFQ